MCVCVRVTLFRALISSNMSATTYIWILIFYTFDHTTKRFNMRNCDSRKPVLLQKYKYKQLEKLNVLRISSNFLATTYSCGQQVVVKTCTCCIFRNNAIQKLRLRLWTRVCMTSLQAQPPSATRTIFFGNLYPVLMDFVNIRVVLKYHKCVVQIHQISISPQPQCQPLNRIIKEVTVL